ncbi:hypothetical protein LTR70_003769 [Exophiala xenobiotica]|nr:hypothetical protein LTR70_003769 [Exophiala xenobiotica]
MVLFAVFDGKQDFEWRGITLNATVSTLSTVSRLTLLIAISSCIGQLRWNLFSQRQIPVSYMDTWDSASRGALGCVTLLLETKSLCVAAAGAWLTVLAIVFEPSIQQALRFRSDYRYVPSGDEQTAEIASAIGWAGGSVDGQSNPLEVVNGAVTTYVAVSLDFSMQSALLYGLVATKLQTLQQAPFQCSSTDCEWKSYDSLAVCSACHDVRDEIAAWDVDASLGLHTLNYYWPDFDTVSDNFTGKIYTLPNNLAIWNKEGFSDQVLMTTTSTSKWSETLRFKENNTLIFALSMLRLPASGVMQPTDLLSWPTASECGIYFCTKSFRSSVVNATFMEEASEISSMMDPTSFQQLLNETRPNRGPEPPDILYDQFNFVQRTDIRILPASGSTSNDLPGAGVSQGAVAALVKTLESLFYASHFKSYLPLNINVGGALRESRRLGTLWYPPSMKPLYDNANFEQTFANLATSMTNDIRRNGRAVQTQQGMVAMPVTLVHIRWVWTAFSCLLVVAGSAFLLVCILLTKRVSIPLWKTSALAVLFHQLRPQPSAEEASHVFSTLEMQRMAAELSGSLADAHILNTASKVKVDVSEEEKGTAACLPLSTDSTLRSTEQADNAPYFASPRKLLPKAHTM